jgi:hypothetical protein
MCLICYMTILFECNRIKLKLSARKIIGFVGNFGKSGLDTISL